MSTTAIQKTPLSLDGAVAAVQHEASGGIVTFVGVVRDHADGLAVAKLEYHAYVSMAETELARIADGIEAELEGTRVACFHRIGTLAVGDAAVICAASAPHRDDAFRACRALIDRVKASVPIWKREHGPEGPYWVGWRDARTTSGDDA